MTPDEILILFLTITSLAGAFGTLWMSHALERSAKAHLATLDSLRESVEDAQRLKGVCLALQEHVDWQETVIRTLLNGGKPASPRPLKADRRIEA